MASIPQPTMDGLPNTGRVPELLTAPRSAAAAQLYQEPRGTPERFNLEATNGWYKTRLNQAFFSAENIEHLQHQIRYRVYIDSGKKYVVDAQSVDQLKLLMLGVFYRDARHVIGKEAQEIAALDETVITEAVKDILSAIEHRQYYLNDVGGNRNIMDRGAHTSSAGTRTPARPLFDKPF